MCWLVVSGQGGLGTILHIDSMTVHHKSTDQWQVFVAIDVSIFSYFHHCSLSTSASVDVFNARHIYFILVFVFALDIKLLLHVRKQVSVFI